MPPLREALSRRFSRDASGLLTRVGHGRLLVIGDSSLDVPDKARKFYYLGNPEGDISAAAALKDIVHACPMDPKIPIRYMIPDEGDKGERTAPTRNREAIKNLGYSAIGLLKDGERGFYEFSRGTDPNKPPIYCLTASELAYDCIVASIGHTQI